MTNFKYAMHVIAFIAVCGIAAAPVGCTMYESKLLVDMVKAGADPVEARCAMSGWSTRETQCLVSQIVKRKKEEGAVTKNESK